MRSLLFLIVTIVTVVMINPSARADRRIFGYTYPYQMLPEGTLELEHYLDAGLNGWDDPNTLEIEDDWKQVDWKHQFEFEYGITDRLDFGFYNVFSQKPFREFAYDGPKLRSRYRFAEQDALIVDPAIYLEIGYFGDEAKLEQILILAKRLSNLEISFNAKFEQEYVMEGRQWEFEFLPLLGIGYHFNAALALGLEYYGKLKVEHGEVEYYVSYLGPTLSVAGGSFFWTLAVQPQLGTREQSAAVQIRSLFGAVL